MLGALAGFCNLFGGWDLLDPCGDSDSDSAYCRKSRHTGDVVPLPFVRREAEKIIFISTTASEHEILISARTVACSLLAHF